MVDQDDAVEGSILDIEQIGGVSIQDNKQVMLKWGYWEECPMSEEDLNRLLQLCDALKE